MDCDKKGTKRSLESLESTEIQHPYYINHEGSYKTMQTTAYFISKSLYNLFNYCLFESLQPMIILISEEISQVFLDSFWLYMFIDIRNIINNTNTVLSYLKITNIEKINQLYPSFIQQLKLNFNKILIDFRTKYLLSNNKEFIDIAIQEAKRSINKISEYFEISNYVSIIEDYAKKNNIINMNNDNRVSIINEKIKYNINTLPLNAYNTNM